MWHLCLVNYYTHSLQHVNATTVTPQFHMGARQTYLSEQINVHFK
uniref:Uncharacterized protein n=1 Tax=Anguilla anguilla TaxID=7936 RepID=A0A0E9XVK7_ANGAN